MVCLWIISGLHLRLLHHHGGSTIRKLSFDDLKKQSHDIWNNGFWDTFRAVHPLFTIMYPSVSSEFMEALPNTYKQGGWLPEWFSPSYKNCMIGQNSVSVVTDAWGYVPNDGDAKQSVSRTLEYAYNDYCIARYAELTGQGQEIIDLH